MTFRYLRENFARTLRHPVRTVVAVRVGSLAMNSAALAGDAKNGSVTYRLMTYNVASAANIPLGPRRIKQIAETIIGNAVDIAGLTEMELGTAWHGGRTGPGPSTYVARHALSPFFTLRTRPISLAFFSPSRETNRPIPAE